MCGLGSAAAWEEQVGRCHLLGEPLGYSFAGRAPFTLGLRLRATSSSYSHLRAGQAVVWIDVDCDLSHLMDDRPVLRKNQPFFSWEFKSVSAAPGKC